MGIEVIVDRELDDGRFVVTNSSRIDIPLGADFTDLFERTAKLVDGEIRDRREGPTAPVELKVQEVEFWRRPHSCIPYGNHAAVRFSGDTNVLRQRLQGRNPNWQLFLGAGKSDA